MQVTNRAVRCPDGQVLQASVYAPAAPAAVVVVAPALGIPRRFYGRLAQYLMERNIAVLSFDYRGSADSALQVGSPRGLQLRDWGEKDLDAVLREAQCAWLRRPLFLLGHSLGNQLAGMAEAAGQLRGFVMVAAPAPHWKHWRGWHRWAFWMWWKAVIPLGCAGRDAFPSRALRFSSVDIPAGPALQWAQAADTEGYLFHPKFGLDLERFRRLSVPALAWQFSDDLYVPALSHEALLRAYPGLRPERREVAPAELGLRRIGHLGFFAPACTALWQQTADWVLARAAAG